MVGRSEPARGASPHDGEQSFDVRVLDQGRVWVERDGTHRPLARMSKAEAVELMAFLLAHRGLFYVLVLRREVTMRLLAVAAAPVAPQTHPNEHERQLADRTRPVGTAVPGRTPLRGLDRRRERLWAGLGRGPDAWLAATPLMRALERAATA